MSEYEGVELDKSENDDMIDHVIDRRKIMRELMEEGMNYKEASKRYNELVSKED